MTTPTTKPKSARNTAFAVYAAPFARLGSLSGWMAPLSVWTDLPPGWMGRLRRVGLLVAVLMAVVCFTSCEKEEGGEPFDAPRRTLLVYLAGDNTISSEVAKVVEAIRKGCAGVSANVVIYHDRQGANPRLMVVRGMDETDPRLETIEEYPVENSASAEVFSRVVQRVVKDFPADSYGLIFTSHGSGWLPSGTLARPTSAPATVLPRMDASPAAPRWGASSQTDGSPHLDASSRPIPTSVIARLGASLPAFTPSGDRITFPRNFALPPVFTPPGGGTTRTIGVDDNPGTAANTREELELPDMARALDGYRFDFIIFEACLMAGVEVAYELRDRCDYLLVSSAELLAPGFVPVYPQVFAALTDSRQPVPRALETFAQTYYDYMNRRSGAFRSATLSIIKTAEMETLADRAEEVLGNSSADGIVSDIPPLQHFDRPGSYGDTPRSPRYFDLGDYLCRIAPDKVARIEEQLYRTVVWKAATPSFMEGYNGFEVKKHCGLTVYIPQEVFPGLNEAYKNTAWYRRISRAK